jgi:iron(II)-dependent oxidoreductase
VGNAEFLAFIEAGGYQTGEHWDESGRAWLAERRPEAPLHWRRDADRQWYAIGLNGPADLTPEEPVTGIGQHEALAFARWAAGLGSATSGAMLQHECQWEVAARAGFIEGTGRAWEWCANPVHPYPELTPFPDSGGSQTAFDGRHFSLRGASLHTQR